MIRTVLILFLALAAGCFKGEASVGTCHADGECAAGSTCDPDLRVCVYSCKDKCAATDICVGGKCVAAVCIPACDTNHQCDTKQSPPVCVNLLDGTASVTKPAASDIVGGPQITLTASAGAPGGPTKVELRIEQGGAVKGTVAITQGNAGVYSGVLPTAGFGLTSGAANIFAKVFWLKAGAEMSKDSSPVAVTVDMDAPSITAGVPLTDQAFYSSVANPTSNATVNINATDVGAAGVNASSARLLLGTHSYPAATTPANGAPALPYTFAVPLADVGVGAGGQQTVGFVVTADDNVGNSGSYDGGAIAIDNKPPVFGTATVDSVNWFDGGTAVPMAIDVTDPAGGSGMNAGTVKLVPPSGTPIGPTSTTNATRSFAPLGSLLQADQQQGAVNLHVTAQDNAGNVGNSPVFTANVDRKPPAVLLATATDNPTVGFNGYYDGLLAGFEPVSVAIDDGTGSGVKSATLAVGNATAVTGAFNSGSGKWDFSVPTSAQTAGSEAQLPFTITTTDNVGNTIVGAIPTNATRPVVKIDAAGPTVTAVAVVGGIAGQQNARWFAYDLTAKLDIQATIVDNGSGLDTTVAPPLLKNVSGGAQIDDGAPTTSGSNYTFHVRRSLVGNNLEGTIGFSIEAQDKFNHKTSQTGAAQIFGLDGKGPVVTFSAVPYPAGRAGCSTDTTNVYCGHDGAHFWRSETATLAFTVIDGGVGVDTTSGTCAISVTSPPSCAVTYNSGANKFTFPVTFSGLSVMTAPDGTATISFTLGAKDLLNNSQSNTPTASADITRVKWVRQTVANNLTGAPVVSPQLNEVIIAGTTVAGTTTLNDPISAINTDTTNSLHNGGALAWSFGHTQSLTSVTTNMALDATPSTDVTHPTPILYLNSGSNLYALHVGASSIDKYCTNSLASAPAGSPVIFGAGATAAVVITGGYQIGAFQTANMSATGGSCALVDSRSFGSIAARPTLGPPSASGANAYFAYNDTEVGGTGDLTVKSISFNGSFGTPSTTNIALTPTVSGAALAPVSPASDLFFGNDFNHKFYDYTTALASSHTSPSLTGAIFTQPTISGGLVFGMTNQLIAYSAANISTVTWTALNSATQVTPPAVGVGMLYLSDAGAKVIHAIDAVNGTTTRSDKWTYAGSATTPPTTITSLTTEPTLAPDGTLYFGDAGGRVYAIITDTVPAATGVADWPRTGYDNCNSNHAGSTGYTCQ